MPQPPERDIDQTRRQLADWLGRQLPNGSNIEVRSLGGPQDTGFSECLPRHPNPLNIASLPQAL